VPPQIPGDAIREKIEALLRLAEDPNASQAERDLALERVTRLATKHQIDASALDPHSGRYTREEIVQHVFTYPTAYALHQTRRHGVYQVIRAMGADAYGRHKRDGFAEEAHVVYAAASVMDVLRILIPSLIVQEMNASAAYIAEFKQSGWYRTVQQGIASLTRQRGRAAARDLVNRRNTEVRRRRTAFAMAFFVEAAKVIRDRRADAVREAGERYAVVLVDVRDRIRRMLEENEDLISPRNTTAGRYHPHAWARGSEAGARALVGQTEIHGVRPQLGG
jgi:hypothetical protein